MQTINHEIELLNIHEACAVLGGLSKNHFYDLIRRGVMPQPVKLSRQYSRWMKSELLEAVAVQAANRNGGAK